MLELEILYYLLHQYIFPVRVISAFHHTTNVSKNTYSDTNLGRKMYRPYV